MEIIPINLSANNCKMIKYLKLNFSKPMNK